MQLFHLNYLQVTYQKRRRKKELEIQVPFEILSVNVNELKNLYKFIVAFFQMVTKNIILNSSVYFYVVLLQFKRDFDTRKYVTNSYLGLFKLFSHLQIQRSRHKHIAILKVPFLCHKILP